MLSSPSPVSADSPDRIYHAAAQLFAEKGFAGASIRDISRAVGLSVSTIQYHVGNKETLYLEILRRTYQMEYDLLSPLLENVEDAVLHDQQALFAVFKEFYRVFIQRILKEPETFRLWAHHFLEESRELEKMEIEFSLPFYQMALNLLQRAKQAGTVDLAEEELRLFISSITWLMHGYFNGRKNNWGDPGYDRFQPENAEAFRQYLNLYTDRMLSTCGRRLPA